MAEKVRLQDLGAAPTDSGTVWVAGVGGGRGQSEQRPVQALMNPSEAGLALRFQWIPVLGSLACCPGQRSAVPDLA